MLPILFSFYPYNASLSQIVFPLSEIEVTKLGGWYYELISTIPEDMVKIDSENVSKSIDEVKDSILETAIISKTLRKPFRIIPDELTFYRNKRLPLPLETPYTRMINRFEYVNYFKTQNDVCDKCGTGILAGNSHKDGFRPYCEECYQKEVL